MWLFGDTSHNAILTMLGAIRAGFGRSCRRRAVRHRFTLLRWSWPQSARDLKHQQSSRLQYSNELCDVCPIGVRWYVLENRVTVHEVKGVISEPTQVGRSIVQVGAGAAEAIVMGSCSDHGLRNIEPIDLAKVRGQCLRKPAETAPEIQRGTAP